MAVVTVSCLYCGWSTDYSSLRRLGEGWKARDVVRGDLDGSPYTTVHVAILCNTFPMSGTEVPRQGPGGQNPLCGLGDRLNNFGSSFDNKNKKLACIRTYSVLWNIITGIHYKIKRNCNIYSCRFIVCWNLGMRNNDSQLGLSVDSHCLSSFVIRWSLQIRPYSSFCQGSLRSPQPRIGYKIG